MRYLLFTIEEPETIHEFIMERTENLSRCVFVKPCKRDVCVVVTLDERLIKDRLVINQYADELLLIINEMLDLGLIDAFEQIDHYNT